MVQLTVTVSTSVPCFCRGMDFGLGISGLLQVFLKHFHVPGSVLGSGGAVASEADEVPTPVRLSVRCLSCELETRSLP